MSDGVQFILIILAFVIAMVGLFFLTLSAIDADLKRRRESRDQEPRLLPEDQALVDRANEILRKDRALLAKCDGQLEELIEMLAKTDPDDPRTARIRNAMQGVIFGRDATRKRIEEFSRKAAVFEDFASRSAARIRRLGG